MGINISKINSIVLPASKKIRTNAQSPKITADSAVFLNKTRSKLINSNCELLPGFKKTPLNAQNLSDIAAENTCLVHLSDWFPSGGKIKSTQQATLEQDGFGQWLSSIHFSINRTVANNSSGNWDNKKYGIILPLDGTLEKNDLKNIIGGRIGDFFVLKEVQMPEGSVIVRKNPQVPKGKLRILDADALVGFKNSKGIKIVESSEDVSMAALTQNIIKKTGKQILDYDMFLPRENNTNWIEFCKKYGFENTWAVHTPWHRTDMIPVCIDLLKNAGDSWSIKSDNLAQETFNKVLFDIECPDMTDAEKLGMQEIFKKEAKKLINQYKYMYEEQLGGEEKNLKTELLKSIENIKQRFVKNKNTTINIDKLEEIIKDSKTPSLALERIKNELNIIPKTDEKAIKTPSLGAFSYYDGFILKDCECQKDVQDTLTFGSVDITALVENIATLKKPLSD